MSKYKANDDIELASQTRETEMSEFRSNYSTFLLNLSINKPSFLFKKVGGLPFAFHVHA